MEEQDYGKEGIAAALKAGQKLGELQAAGTVHAVQDKDGQAVSVPFLMKRQGYDVASLEHLMPSPFMTRASVSTDDADGFIAYVNRFKDEDSVIFAALADKKFEAVLDFPKPTEARWGKHRASFSPSHTPDWITWTANNGPKQAKSQVDFARFIEENLPNIAEPAGADLLEMCLTLEAKTDVSFRSSARLRDGQHQIRYEETIDAKAGANSGNVTIPDKLTLVLKPFVGMEDVQVEARFRFRIGNGTLVMWYELARVDDVLRTAFEAITAKIKAGVTGTTFVNGKAPTIS